jgi:hypothetical protein
MRKERDKRDDWLKAMAKLDLQWLFARAVEGMHKM